MGRAGSPVTSHPATPAAPHCLQRSFHSALADPGKLGLYLRSSVTLHSSYLSLATEVCESCVNLLVFTRKHSLSLYLLTGCLLTHLRKKPNPVCSKFPITWSKSFYNSLLLVKKHPNSNISNLTPVYLFFLYAPVLRSHHTGLDTVS